MAATYRASSRKPRNAVRHLVDRLEVGLIILDQIWSNYEFYAKKQYLCQTI